jgi:hypothetical protein
MTEDQATREELQMLYQITVSDLTYFKTQQWSVTNYALAVLAGLIGVTQFLKPSLDFCDRWILVVLAAAVAVFVLIVLSKLQRSIAVRQARLEAIRANFSLSFRQAWAAEIKGKEFLHAVHFLYAAVFFGATLATWLIGFRL